MLFHRGGSCCNRRRFDCLQEVLENCDLASSWINTGEFLEQLQVQACIQGLVVPHPTPLESLKVQDIEVFALRAAVVDTTHRTGSTLPGNCALRKTPQDSGSP